MLSRYIDELVSIQCLLLGPDHSLFREQTHVTSSGLVSIVPILHAFLLLAVLESCAQAFQVPGLVNVFTRFLCIAPFVAASLFLISNEAYIIQFKARIGALGQGELAKRRQSAKLFAFVSVAGGIAALWTLILSQGHRVAT